MREVATAVAEKREVEKNTLLDTNSMLQLNHKAEANGFRDTEPNGGTAMKNGNTYSIDGTSCWIVKSWFECASVASIAEDYAQLVDEATAEYAENGNTKRLESIKDCRRRMAWAIAKAEGIL